MRRSLLIFYGLGPVLLGIGIAAILHYGLQLQSPSVHPAGGAYGNGLQDNLQHPLAVLIVQIITVIGAAKLLGWVFRLCKQPAVIGEMLAGILLGPSLLGMTFPVVENFLFPAASLGTLKLLSQIGVILYMFLVGIELDLPSLRQRARAAVMVSHASIAAPFFLGAALALPLYSSLAAPDISFAAFALFMGTAMSVTAFPVLARIIAERGLAGTQLGAIAIACAAVDDVTAWCILAVVVAIAKAQGLSGAALTIALALLFIGAMLLLVRPLLARVMEVEPRDEAHGHNLVVGVLVLVFAAALFTEVIGIHALFGAFLAGAIMPPRARLSRLLRERIETFGGVFLLPLFFAFTGLRTDIGLLAGWHDWLICGGIIAVAIAGKFGGSAIAARWAGLSWPDSFALGALMNTRGLMELIALNIGYDLGILSPRIFTMMVIMALVTTFMTGPLLSLVDKYRRAPLRTGAPIG